jgi:hypothetical protein
LKSRLSVLLGLSLVQGCADDAAQSEGDGETGSAGDSGASGGETSSGGDGSTSGGTTGDSGDGSSDSGDSTTGDPPDPAEPMFEFGTIAEFDIQLSQESIDSLWIDPKLYVLGDVTVTLNGISLKMVPLPRFTVPTPLKETLPPPLSVPVFTGPCTAITGSPRMSERPAIRHRK